MKEIPHIFCKCEDGLEFLRQIKSEHVDLVLTDPPYEISKKTGFAQSEGENTIERFKISYEFGDWDKVTTDLFPWIKQMYRILKDGGSIIIFYDLWKISNLKSLLEKNNFKQIRFIEWVKTNPVPINSKINYLTNAREIALTAVKKSKPTFNSKYDNGIYEYPIYHSKRDRFHPTQKNLKLFEDLIKKHSNQNDIIVDPFMGSGTTAVAAIKNKRNFLGCEIDSFYFDACMKRIKFFLEEERLKKSDQNTT